MQYIISNAHSRPVSNVCRTSITLYIGNGFEASLQRINRHWHDNTESGKTFQSSSKSYLTTANAAAYINIIIWAHMTIVFFCAKTKQKSGRSVYSVWWTFTPLLPLLPLHRLLLLLQLPLLTLCASVDQCSSLASFLCPNTFNQHINL